MPGRGAAKAEAWRQDYALRVCRAAGGQAAGESLGSRQECQNEGSPVRTSVQIPLPVQLAAIQVFRREPIKLAHLSRIPPGCQGGSQETTQMSERGSVGPRTWELGELAS